MLLADTVLFQRRFREQKSDEAAAAIVKWLVTRCSAESEEIMKSKTSKTTRKASKVLRDAMNLPPADRADIASCLYGSLNGDYANQLHPAWDQEVERRIREVEEGKVKPIPTKKAMQQIFADA